MFGTTYTVESQRCDTSGLATPGMAPNNRTVMQYTGGCDVDMGSQQGAAGSTQADAKHTAKHDGV